MREPKFNFLPFVKYTSPRGESLSVSITKAGLVQFTKHAIDKFALKDQWLRFYTDVGKGTIAFKKLTDEPNLEALQGIRKLYIHEKLGVGRVSIGKMLKSVGLKLPTETLHSELKIYKTLMDGELYYFSVV
jgi:hypothetical protein